MSAVLILAGSHAIPMSFSASVLAFGIVVAAMLSAVWQWIASAQTKKATVTTLLTVAVVLTISYVVIGYDCGELWWLWCGIFI